MAQRNPPTEDELHWMTVQELRMREDKEQCESWKGEVENILIFSGLFSAIVTAFVIESQKALRPDPAQQSVQLLMQIANQTAGKDWVAPGPAKVNHSDNCVNVLWFLSLVLSLTAALMGIVALQWIRTHVRSLRGGPDALGVSHIHSLGLHRSYIPLIFTSLPVLLISGLTFFLVGLVVFLFQLGWHVALPVAIAIGLPLAFLIITTTHPTCQWLPRADRPDTFPSPYRSPQSLIVLQTWTLLKRLWRKIRSPEGQGKSDSTGGWRSRLQHRKETRPLTNLESGQDVEAKPLAHDRTDAPVSAKGTRFDWTGDWTSRSLLWLRQRENDFAAETRRLTHLKPPGAELKVFPYDTIQALVSVKESRSAESENEITGLAKCLAEVAPIHFDLFSTGDLADLIPFLPPSKFVPSGLFIRENSATREDLSAFALLQVATRKGQPSDSDDLIKACVLATRWLFERPRTFDSAPDRQPLDLIPELDPDTDSRHIHEPLIETLIRFFTFATDFQPESHSINRTTYTSSYTYWFLDLSAKILTKVPLPIEMQSRHTYILPLIATSLEDSGKDHHYLFFTASIYASAISGGLAGDSKMCSTKVGGRFLRAVRDYHKKFKDDPKDHPLRAALRVHEVLWDKIDQAIRDLESQDVVSGGGGEESR